MTTKPPIFPATWQHYCECVGCGESVQVSEKWAEICHYTICMSCRIEVEEMGL